MRLVARVWSAAAAVGLAGTAAVAADPPPGPHILAGKSVDPDAVRRVAEYLATADGSAPKGSLVDEALELVRRNKGANLRELAAEMARRHQELTAPDRFDALVEQLHGLQRLAGPFAQMLPDPSAEPPAAPGPEAPTPVKVPTPGPAPGPARLPPATSPPNPSAKTPAPAEGPKPNTPSAGPNGSPASTVGTPPKPATRSADPKPNADRGPGDRGPGDRGSGRRRPFDAPWEQVPPAFLDAMPAEGDSWQAREQKIKAETESRTKRQRQFDAVYAFWEKNVGDLDNTPAVRDLLRDMFAGPTPIAPDAAEGLLALLGDPTSNPRGFVKWATTQGNLFDDIGKVNPFGRRFGGIHLPAFDAAPMGGGALAYQPGAMTGEGTWLPVVLFAAVAGGSLLAWRFWPRGGAAEGPRPVPGLGPWPVDPRLVADRADLIRAFEYLSVLVCGAGARAAHHLAIADALRAATGSGDAAEPLARGYALARYTPAADPLPPGTIAEARGHLCRLAGVPAP